MPLFGLSVFTLIRHNTAQVLILLHKARNRNKKDDRHHAKTVVDIDPISLTLFSGYTYGRQGNVSFLRKSENKSGQGEAAEFAKL